MIRRTGLNVNLMNTLEAPNQIPALQVPMPAIIICVLIRT